MDFSSPRLLWALPLALVPILLHLLSLRRARKVVFSDTTLLRKAHLESLPRRRLRSWLLLAARCALIGCLILAYAGPVVPLASTGASPAAGEGLDLVLLLDASYSMGAQLEGRSLFEAAREAGVEIVHWLGASDRIAVGIFSERLENPSGPLRWVASSEALLSLQSARLGFRSTDFTPAVAAASELLAGDLSRRRAIVLLTDGARHGIRKPIIVEPGVSLLSLAWPAERANAFVDSVSLLAPSANELPRLQAVVTQSGGAARTSSLDLWVGPARTVSQAVELRPGRDSTVVAALPSRAQAAQPAWSGRVALRPDALSADDAYFYSFSRQRRPRVLCLYGAPDFLKAPRSGYFLSRILGGGAESLLDFDADFLDLSLLGQARLSEYSAVLLADFKDLSPSAAAVLDSFVQRGGGLAVLPGTRLSVSGLKAVESWLPARVGPAVDSPRPQGLKAQGSLLSGDFQLDRVSIARLYSLSPAAKSRVLMTNAAEAPLLVVGGHGEGRVAVWASTLDPAWSTLALKPVFAAWLGALLQEIIPRDSAPHESLNLFTGQPIRRVWDLKEPAPARVSLKNPEGRVSSLWVKDRRVEYLRTDQPGLYVMTEEGLSRSAVYAVNLDRSSESDLSPAFEAPWRELGAESLLADLSRALYGRDARPELMALAVFLIIIEMILSLPGLAGRLRLTFAIILFTMAAAPPLSAQAVLQGDRFVWAQLKLGPDWDPYPEVSADVLELFSTVTSVLSVAERRVLTLKDRELFSSPFLLLAGRQAPPSLSDEELENLRQFLMAGGTLWIEDVSGAPSSSFDRWVRRVLPSVLPEGELSPVGADHVVFKTFFLLRGATGRVMVKGFLEGIPWAGRLAVIYSRNDMLGAWAKDAMGSPLHRCVPGGEAQRHWARKLTMNLLMYSLTGSYKADAVHQPFLLQRIRAGVP